ncbi:MAG TPA: hypothetical protein VNU26_09645, partial [Mycobacteriales bacterium]|nr:hypothetical protein [Mycobacteriales bacterium]
MTVPDLTPEEPETGTRREHVVEHALIVLIVVLAGALALPSLVTALREGSASAPASTTMSTMSACSTT